MIANDGRITIVASILWSNRLETALGFSSDAGDGSSTRYGTRRAAAARCGRALVKAYRYTLSPLIGFHCRYLPTCSEYADQALDRHGLWAGGWMTTGAAVALPSMGQLRARLSADAPGRARWYLPWRYGRWRGTNAEPHVQ